MKQRLAILGVMLIAAAAILFYRRLELQARPPAKAIRNASRPTWDYFPGRVIVKFKPAVKNVATDARARALLQTHQATGMRPLFPHARDPYTAAQDRIGLSRIALMEVPAHTDVETLAAQLQQHPLVEYAEPDYLIPLDAIPNDALFSRQQYLTQIKAPEAWELARGDSAVVIAIIDSGTDWQHPDLAANIWKNIDEIPDGSDNDGNGFIDDVRGWDFVDHPPNPYPGEDAETPDNDPMDFAGHGTGVAGVAAAVTDNSAGIAALSWNVKLMPLRVGWLRLDGVSLVDAAWTAAAFVYAADNGAHVANLSAGSTRVVADAAAYAFQKDVVVTSAAGNASNEDAFGLSLSPFAITVAAVNDRDEYASYTSFGDWVKVCAPGGDLKPRRPGILTTYLHHDYQELQGTSFAAPLTASLAALVKSQHPDWTPAQVTFQVVETADNVDARNPDFMRGKLGRGRINAQRALGESVLAAPHLSLDKIESIDAGGNGFWDAGEMLDLVISLRNDWGDAGNLVAEISSDDYAVRIAKGRANYGTLPGLSDLSAQTQSNRGDPFILTADAAALPHRARFKLRLYADGDYQKSFDFYLALTPSVLLVDDDDGKNNVEIFYTEVLDSLGLSFDIFTHAGAELPVNLLQKYPTVIWACEWAFPSLNLQDRARLQQYFQAGGNLFLSGQDIGWDLCDPVPGVSNEFNVSGGASQTFYEEFLHARYLRDDANTSQIAGVDGDPVGAGLAFNFRQPGRTVSEQLPSEIFPFAPATGILKYPSGEIGALRFAGDYRLVYFAFGGYEAVVPKPARDALMPRVLNWLNGFQLEHTPLRDTDDTTRTRLISARIISEISPPQRVELHWDTDGQLPFNKVAMQHTGNGEYRAEIPPQFKKNVDYFFFVATERGFAAPLQRFSYATFPDTIPPVLENLRQVPNTLNSIGPYAVSVEARDESGLDTSNLAVHFHAPSGRQGFMPLQPNFTQPGVFATGIGGGFAYGDTVFYRVRASDLALNRNRSETPEKFFLMGLNDFEAGYLREWNTDTSGWGVTTTRVHAGAYAANSNPGRVYPLHHDTALESSAPVDLSRGAVKLIFFEQHYFEAGQEDFGLVEISYAPPTQAWEPLSESFRGMQSQWQKREYIIPARSGARVARLRFRVQTDGQPNPPRPGWFIDDVRLLAANASSVSERSSATPVPAAFALAQNYPNPFSWRAAGTFTALRFDLPVPAEVNLSIYDVLGRRVAGLVHEKKNAGVHFVRWNGVDENGRRVAAGVYLYRLQAVADGRNVFQGVRKLLVAP